MDDLISRAALLGDLSYCAPELWQDEEYVKAKIMKQPAVDAAPVVRCRNCKDYEPCPEGECGTCNLLGGLWEPNDFCSDGERRDGDA